MRDATVVLDEIVDNETDLAITEHTNRLGKYSFANPAHLDPAHFDPSHRRPLRHPGDPMA